MKLIQLFNILVFLCMVYGANIKPENWDELEYIQISNKNDKKSRYYKLDRKSEIVFDNLDLYITASNLLSNKPIKFSAVSPFFIIAFL